jgi:HEAT repeat protein
MVIQFHTVFDFIPARELVVSFAFIFLVCGIAAIIMLFASRVIKSGRLRRANSLRTSFQKTLNKIVVNESFGQETQGPAFEFYIAELRYFTEGSSLARQVLIDQIVDLKKSLTGNSARALIQTYKALLLHEESLKKLKAHRWEKRASGIRQLAEMGVRQSIPDIKRNLSARNPTLREETLVAMVRLEAHPLSFMNSYPGYFSAWMRINIFNYLRKIDPRDLPLFSQWFNHTNQSAILFAISMASEFKQMDSLPGLAKLLHSPDDRIVGMAASAIGELEAFQYRQQVAGLSSRAWNSPGLAGKVIACIGKIGDLKNDGATLVEFLSHPNYDVRFEAVAALLKFGKGGAQYLQAHEVQADVSVAGIVKHFSDPYLQ